MLRYYLRAAIEVEFLKGRLKFLFIFLSEFSKKILSVLKVLGKGVIINTLSGRII